MWHPDEQGAQLGPQDRPRVWLMSSTVPTGMDACLGSSDFCREATCTKWSVQGGRRRNAASMNLILCIETLKKHGSLAIKSASITRIGSAV